MHHEQIVYNSIERVFGQDGTPHALQGGGGGRVLNVLFLLDVVIAVVIVECRFEMLQNPPHVLDAQVVDGVCARQSIGVVTVGIVRPARIMLCHGQPR